MAKLTQVDFPPRELVSYSKETQTPVSTQPKDGTSHTRQSQNGLLCVQRLYYNDLWTFLQRKRKTRRRIWQWHRLLSRLTKMNLTLRKRRVKDSVCTSIYIYIYGMSCLFIPFSCFCFGSPAPHHELTEEEKQQILHSDDFLTFFDHSSRIVERALSEQVDVCFDYSGRDLQDKEGWASVVQEILKHLPLPVCDWVRYHMVACDTRLDNSFDFSLLFIYWWLWNIHIQEEMPPLLICLTRLPDTELINRLMYWCTETVSEFSCVGVGICMCVTERPRLVPSCLWTDSS